MAGVAYLVKRQFVALKTMGSNPIVRQTNLVIKMRLKKYVKASSSFDIVYRSVNITNPLGVPKLKKSFFNKVKSNSSQVLTDALMLKVSSSVASPSIKVIQTQEMNRQFKSNRNAEKIVRHKFSCGKKLTLNFLDKNFGTFSSKTNLVGAKVKKTNRFTVALIESPLEESLLYTHLNRKGITNTSTSTSVYCNNKSISGTMMLSSLTPLSPYKKSKRVNIFREVLSDIKS